MEPPYQHLQSAPRIDICPQRLISWQLRDDLLGKDLASLAHPIIVPASQQRIIARTKVCQYFGTQHIHMDPV